ncbi:MAG: FkbM family methyltransferase [Nanoarchaeota archaeon]
MSFHRYFANHVVPLSYWLFYLDKKKTYEVSKKKFRIRQNSSDKYSIWDVWKASTYFDKELDIGRHDIVIEIGGNIGAFAVRAASSANKGKVYTFEPDKNNFKMLVSNVALNYLNNVTAFNIAVSNKKGYADFHLSEKNSASHSLYGSNGHKKTKVKTTTLKEIVEKHNIPRIDYLKIDAEGAEYEIILNAPDSIWKKIDKIALEYHDHLSHGHTYKELVNFLTSKGFKVRIAGNPLLRSITKIGIIKARR